MGPWSDIRCASTFKNCKYPGKTAWFANSSSHNNFPLDCNTIKPIISLHASISVSIQYMHNYIHTYVPICYLNLQDNNNICFQLKLCSSFKKIRREIPKVMTPHVSVFLYVSLMCCFKGWNLFGCTFCINSRLRMLYEWTYIHAYVHTVQIISNLKLACTKSRVCTILSWACTILSWVCTILSWDFH